MIPVVWKSYHDSPPRGYYDQALLEWLFAQKPPDGHNLYHTDSFPVDPAQGVVLVTPGHWRDAEAINADLAERAWVLLIITSDEEGECPFWQIQHPNISIWKHTPRQDIPWQPDRPLPLGWSPGTVEANRARPSKDWGLDWFFAGQITHGRRLQAAEMMRTMTDGKLVETSTFLDLEGGMNRTEYFDHLRRAKVVPSPSGPNIPDTFRFYEALESGAVPLADATCPRGDTGYWQRVFGEVAFPIVADWSQLPALVEEWKQQQKRVEVLAWWEQAKRDLVWQLHDDLTRLQGGEVSDKLGDGITVIIPTSPIISHPSTAIIEETVGSVRSQLPDAEILIGCDGIRPQLARYTETYTEYLEALIWKCREWRAVPFVFPTWQHQAALTRHLLTKIRTPLLLFVEHDTPLIGQIPWRQLGHLILNEDYWLIRLHHETQIPREHNWLMRGAESRFQEGQDYRFLKTVQWSQRPHLARTENYRIWLDAYFSTGARTMIEDRMHGIVERAEWEDFKIAIYHPNRGIQRSRHLDGRGPDPKYESEFVF